MVLPLGSQEPRAAGELARSVHLQLSGENKDVEYSNTLEPLGRTQAQRVQLQQAANTVPYVVSMQMHNICPAAFPHGPLCRKEGTVESSG